MQVACGAVGATGVLIGVVQGAVGRLVQRNPDSISHVAALASGEESWIRRVPKAYTLPEPRWLLYKYIVSRAVN